MEIKFLIMILLATGFPILVLIPAQVFLTLKEKKPIWQILPSLLSILGMMVLGKFLPDHGILKILAVLYCILLLILCGTGWVIAWSVKKSRRIKNSGQ